MHVVMCVGVKPQMEALTTQQQELSLASDDHNDKLEEDRNDSKKETLDGNMASVDKDVSSYTEKTEATEYRSSDDPNVGDTSINESSSINGTSGAPEDLPEPPEAEISGRSFATSGSESDSVNLMTQKLDPYSELQPEGENLIINSLEKVNGNPHSSSELSQSESTMLGTSLDSQLDGVLKLKIDDSSDARSSPASQDVDLNNMEEVSAEGEKSSLALHNPTVTESSGGSLIPDISYPFTSEQLASVHQNINETKSLLDLNGLGVTFTSAGIPAPTVVSTTLQEAPGKVLVPAAVDQVQGQALAALQALKVLWLCLSCVHVARQVIVTSGSFFLFPFLLLKTSADLFLVKCLFIFS